MANQHRKYWPTSLRESLFLAAFLEGDAALEAWEKWLSQVNMQDYPDWGSFRLLPQLYRNMLELGVDDPVMMKLKGIVRRNWFENQRYLSNIEPLLHDLHEPGGECMLLDGPALVLTCGLDYALAKPAVLPIMVRVDRADEVMDTLLNLGWRAKGWLPHAYIESYLAAGWTHTFVDSKDRQIQLAWRLLPANRHRAADAAAWNGASSTSVRDTPVTLLDPAEHILRRCAGDFPTVESSLFLRAIDVMFIIRATPDLNWQRLLRLTAELRLAAPVGEVLNLLQGLLDQPIPDTVWQEFQNLPVSGQERFENRLNRSKSLAGAGLWQHWYNYHQPDSPASRLYEISGFPRYLQHVWRLHRLRQVPRHAAVLTQQRLLRRHT